MALITLTPATGIVGSSVVITGSSFTPFDLVTFTWGGGGITPTETTVSVLFDGSFVCHVVVPSGTGTEAVVATDAHSLTNSQNYVVLAGNSYGVYANAFNAENVKLQIGTGIELITLTNNEQSKDHPRTRIQTRGGAFDTVSSALFTVNCDAIVSKDVFMQLMALNTRGSRGVLPSQSYTVYSQNEGGNVANDITMTFTAILPTFNFIAGPTGSYIVRFSLVINNSSVLVT